MELPSTFPWILSTILSLVLGVIAVLWGRKREEEVSLEALEKISEKTHETIDQDAQESHDKVTEAAGKKDAASAVADLFNDRKKS